MRIVSFLVILGVLVIASPQAFSQQLDNIYDDWSVFTLDQKGKKVCYIASSPTKKSGNYKKRGEPYLLVTSRSADVDEISTSSGYAYKRNSTVAADVDGKEKFQLFTSVEVQDVAWARNASQDKKIVDAMVKGNKINIKAESQVDTQSEDTYSLRGFSKAYKRMKDLCK